MYSSEQSLLNLILFLIILSLISFIPPYNLLNFNAYSERSMTMDKFKQKNS